MVNLKKLNSQQNHFNEYLIQKADVFDEEVALSLFTALNKTVREIFLPEEFRNNACDDFSIPLGYGRLSSIPSSLIRILSLANVKSGSRVLQIGSDGGYASALLANMGAQVFVLEPVGLLAQVVRKNFDANGYQKIIIKMGDEQRGWHEHAPFDSIIFLHPVPAINKVIISQLADDNGRIIAPVGDAVFQTLNMLEKNKGDIKNYKLEKFNVI